jgi:hypothetical protein
MIDIISSKDINYNDYFSSNRPDSPNYQNYTPAPPSPSMTSTSKTDDKSYLPGLKGIFNKETKKRKYIR